jgi:putative CocE/NonD family hydrolase
MRWRDAWLTCRDGVGLVSRIWQPSGSGPWPVLLMRQPYGRAIASTPVLPHPLWFADQGFLVAVQDVRGQGDSEGCFSGFSQEARDTADTLRWVRRLSGCNGRVGMVGFSYQGLTQLLSDAPDGEGLPDCLAPAMTGLDERHHWACSGGAHWWALGLGWGLQLAALQCRRRGDRQGWWRIRHSLESGRFLQEGTELLEQLDPSGMAMRWLGQDPGRSQDWIRHEPPPALWRRPMLLIGGWYDPHLEGVLEIWRRARRAVGSPLLRIGAWTHLD